MVSVPLSDSGENAEGGRRGFGRCLTKKNIHRKKITTPKKQQIKKESKPK